MGVEPVSRPSLPYTVPKKCRVKGVGRVMGTGRVPEGVGVLDGWYILFSFRAEDRPPFGGDDEGPGVPVSQCMELPV